MHSPWSRRRHRRPARCWAGYGWRWIPWDRPRRRRAPSDWHLPTHTHTHTRTRSRGRRRSTRTCLRTDVTIDVTLAGGRGRNLWVSSGTCGRVRHRSLAGRRFSSVPFSGRTSSYDDANVALRNEKFVAKPSVQPTRRKRARITQWLLGRGSPNILQTYSTMQTEN